ncbi:MAG: hypothetical protein HQK83_04510 [Fibrobacteria bacterium]|nr:hypothetical protein [Fibrobacteria bacterium]
MSTFKSLIGNVVDGSEKSSFYDENSVPDGAWALNGTLIQDHLLAITFEESVDVLPKLIIDSFINKYERIPSGEDITSILEEVAKNMKIAIQQGKTPNKAK